MSKDEFTQSIAVLLVTRSKSVEKTLRSVFTPYGYTIRVWPGDVLDPCFQENLSSILVVVLDYEILWRDGDIKLLESLKKSSPNLRILAVGTKIVSRTKRFLLEAGLHGYLALPEEMHLLLKATKEIISGGLWFERSILNIAILGVNSRRDTAMLTPSQSVEAMLTRQEVVVADCVCQGLSNGKIAIKLSISEKTVKLHLTRVYQKLKVSNRVQLVLLLHTGSLMASSSC